ncbi:MAG TPA: hypothetical protein HA254_02945 [Candidatus Diapherotrites archaeon]|uniref:4-vinyl reductase 4VR domain-containing protein n=1 Tax=Candidatus Iainarchaeum sp. TaxID=3101447 RepID=A0A7J4J2Y6_9ARCH|nr:hypothetical protein [Candidatus Diapherotrites archaeon]
MLNSFYDKFIFTNALHYTHNNFYLINMPFAIIPIDVIAGICQKEDRETNLQIYYSVKEAVKTSVRKDFKIDFGLEGEKGLEFMEAFITASGWGKIEKSDISMEKAHALVSASNSAVAARVRDAKMPVDTLLRAILAGIYSIYFKRDVDCVEVKCTALNCQQCDFVIKPAGEFNFDNPITRSQLRA